MKIEFSKIDQAFFDSLLDNAMKTKEKGVDIYNESYQYFTGYFDKADPIGLDNFYIGVYFTYGWMPTIPEIKLSDPKRLLACLNFVKAGNLLPDDDLLFLKGAVNNSIVGGSKLLHFIRPDIYPIWDSNIAAFFCTDGKLHAYAVNSVRIYKSYIDFVQNVIENQEFKPCYEVVSQCFIYPITPVRALEYILFSTFRNSKQGQIPS
jgi:hypothetical protein